MIGADTLWNDRIMHGIKFWPAGLLGVLICALPPMANAVDVDAGTPYGARTEVAQRHGPYPWNYDGVLPRTERPALVAGACASTAPTPRVLIAGDSWAQYMWDDDVHNAVLDRFGQADKLAVSRSLGSNPGPDHDGSEYAVSGSEAREWVDTARYPWIANTVAELSAKPSIDMVMFSLGGNDVLAGKSGGGWYKDMDLDVPGSEQALFDRILSDSAMITDAFKAVRPELDVLVSSYEYPNFNVAFGTCWLYACPKRKDLSRDPDNDLITDAQLNGMMLDVEFVRMGWTNADSRLYFDHGVGAMHHYYGDGSSAPGILPRPGQAAPDYLPFPAGNPDRPSLRANFRTVAFLGADPIHLNADGYRYKAAVQTESHFFPRFRGPVSRTLTSLGGEFDGWSNGTSAGSGGIRVGSQSGSLIHGIVSFDTSEIPGDAQIEAASLYLLQDNRSGTNPFIAGQLGTPRLDVAASFGAPEVEAGDASAPADVSDVGCFVGSANDRYHALRVDLEASALAAIQRDGITQFRLQFSTATSSAAMVTFNTGDAPLARGPEFRQVVHQISEEQPDGSFVIRDVTATALVHRGLVEVLGSARPILDIRYTVGDAVFSDGFEIDAGPERHH